MSSWRRGTALTTALAAGAMLVSGCTSWWTPDASSGGGSVPAPTQTASAEPTLVGTVLAGSPVVARLTRQGGAPTVRTSAWAPGDGPDLQGMAIQLTYRKDVHLVGVVPLVTPTGATSYRVEKMRVDATARRFLVYVDLASGKPKVVGITAGE